MEGSEVIRVKKVTRIRMHIDTQNISSKSRTSNRQTSKEGWKEGVDGESGNDDRGKQSEKKND